MFRAFKGGIYPPHKKSYTEKEPIKISTLPPQVIIHLSQHVGKPSRPIVGIGDHVNTGTKIAEAAGFISCSQHASVSGTVKEIAEFPHPTAGHCLSVVIESDGQDTKEKKIDAQDTIKMISAAGVIGMGGGGFPTHVKLSEPKGKKIDVLIINGAECEPYLTCDHRIMLERPGDILKGADIMRKTLGVERCIIAIEDNKGDAISALQTYEVCKDKPRRFVNISVVSLPTKYPQGAEKQLIKTLLNREVPAGGLPFDVGVVVQNAGTALAVYEAVVLGKPLYERVVTVSGDCVKTPSNILARIGTPVSHLAEQCGGFIKEPAKVICGGPIMGIARHTYDFPVRKGTSGSLFLSKEALDLRPASTCIRCGGCASVCPMGLAPTTIYSLAERDRFEETAEYDVASCIECGACAWECPAKLDLVGMFKYAKRQLPRN